MTSDEYGEIRADALDGNEDLNAYVTPTRRAQAARVIRRLRAAAKPYRVETADEYIRGYMQGRSDLAHQILEEMGIR